ncbi:MAG: DUF3494 domain-containing protein, partial [Acidobacteria bacterium]|nr:DUF3494 domain-containing protein [Acidobacteriota bacterium]
TVSAQSSESSERNVQNLESFPSVGSNELATSDMIRNALSNRTNNLSDLFSSVSQLPCTEVGGEELGGRSFKAGVYCVPSARLAGEMVLDGGGDASAIFIFNVKGSLEAMRESNISLVNEAKSYNVFFVADNATIGEGSNFGASILAKNAIRVNNTARVAGKILSVSGEVDAPEAASPDGGGIGNLEICKRIVGNAAFLGDRVFNFTITNATGFSTTVQVRAGFCTSDILVPAGPATITESTTTNNLTGTGGSQSGGFALVAVNTLSPTPNTAGNLLNSSILSTRQAFITIGGTNSTSLNQLTVEFVNRPAFVGFVEICKQPAFITGSTTILDPDVQGTFSFTIAGVFAPGSNTVLQIFTVAVGQCTGAIAVTFPFDGPTPPAGTVRTGTVVVTELGGVDGSVLVATNTTIAGRAVGVTTFFANGGGSREVTVVEGGVATETIINFFNRARRGQLKVCKVAGFGVAPFTLFNFVVRGTGPTNLAGEIGLVNIPVTVAAGNCTIVTGFGGGLLNGQFQTFVAGSVIQIDEVGPTTLGGGTVFATGITTTTSFVSASTSIGQVRGAIRTEIGGTSAFANVIASSGTTEVTFTNVVFQPTILKVCKIAGPGVALGTSFTFNVTVAGTNANIPVTVTAGPAFQGGNCVLVPGTTLTGGSFNIGSTISITEAVAGTTTISGITSGTSTMVPITRGVTLTGAGGLVAGTTEVTFTNTGTGTTPTPTPTPTATPQPTPQPATCTPTTTVTEGDLFPGGIPSFLVTSGPGTVTVDHVNAGTGTRSITVVGTPINAVVNIPAFTPGTFDPVNVTFTTPNSTQSVDFTLRAASLFHSIFIRVRCPVTAQ